MRDAPERNPMVRAWKVRSRPGSIEVPIRDPRVALVYRRMGWEAFSARVPELGEIPVRRPK
jgi:hypothetical protein